MGFRPFLPTGRTGPFLDHKLIAHFAIHVVRKPVAVNLNVSLKDSHPKRKRFSCAVSHDSRI